MYWSISESKTFRKCQLLWYFKNILASHRAKDPEHRRAYLLGKLQSVHSWRGKIVDDVISEFIVPEVRSRKTVTLQAATQWAKNSFDRQLQYGRTQRLADLSLVPSQEGDDFIAFHKVAYGEMLGERELDAAWSEVELALKNLFAMRNLAAALKRASYLVAQRALMFPHSGMTVRAVPDLIAFYDDGPPLIIDWKVHAFGVQEARVQLATYAVALLRCKPHRDFPTTLALATLGREADRSPAAPRPDPFLQTDRGGCR